MDAEEFRRAAHSAVDEIVDYFTTLDSRRVLANVSPGYLRPLLPSAAPEEGEKWEDIQKDIETKIMPGLTHWYFRFLSRSKETLAIEQSPNFMAFFPANVTYPSILGEMYSAAFTAPAFNWLCSPACTELETIVLDWLCSLLHLPASYLSTSASGGGGVIQGSASEAIVTVMIAARERFIKEYRGPVETSKNSPTPTDEQKEEKAWRLRTRLVALGSEMSHSSTEKAAKITGVNYRSIPVTAADQFSLTGQGLKEALLDLTRNGWEPFYLTVTLGTTSTCAVDQFKEIAEVKKQYPNLWIHVDAAYAGPVLLLDKYRVLTESFEAFDSFDFNMHKWLLTNFDASCLFLPRREPVVSALSITPSYLQNNYSSSGLVTDYRDWQIPLGRRFRALKIWFVLRSYGVNGLKRHVTRHIELGDLFADLVKKEGKGLFELVAKPRFALTVLRVKVPGEVSNETRDEGRTETKMNEGVMSDNLHDVLIVKDDDKKSSDDGLLSQGNAVTKEVYETINAAGEIFLTGTLIKDVYAIRVVGANEQTDEAHLRKAFDILVKTTKNVLERWGKRPVTG
ncbi:MAG: hypothetical protein L6R40_000599 [Gallowayella cf. fulva]|nr:MAG: hypothetical protein L6R40_000599 [Xanthomendoza cf. fulva]